MTASWRIMAMRIRATIAVVAMLAVAGCGSDDGNGSSGGGATATDKVEIKEFKYAPETIEVKAGGKVSFTNQDTAKHTATSQPQGTFDSGDISKGQTKPVTFKKAGSFELFCVYHPTMSAKVKVTE